MTQTRDHTEIYPIADFTNDWDALLRQIPSTHISLTDENIAQVVRLRLVGATWQNPYWDVSYCIAKMRTGMHAFRFVDFPNIPLGYTSYYGDLVQWGIRNHRYMKGLIPRGNISLLNG